MRAGTLATPAVALLALIVFTAVPFTECRDSNVQASGIFG